MFLTPTQFYAGRHPCEPHDYGPQFRLSSTAGRSRQRHRKMLKFFPSSLSLNKGIVMHRFKKLLLIVSSAILLPVFSTQVADAASCYKTTGCGGSCGAGLKVCAPRVVSSSLLQVFGQVCGDGFGDSGVSCGTCWKFVGAVWIPTFSKCGGNSLDAC